MMSSRRGKPPLPGSTSGLFLGSPHADPVSTLKRLIDSVRQGDPLSPLTVVGPSIYANLALRRALGRSGFANVRFWLLPWISESLGAPSLAARGRRPLTSIIESASLRAALATGSGVLSELRSHPSSIRSLRNTFRQIRHAGDGALDRLGGRGRLQREVVELYRRFRRRTRDYYDSEDLARAAAAAVDGGIAPALADLGFVLFYSIRSLSPGERALVRTLAQRGGCAVILGLSGDREADEPLVSLADDLSSFLGSPERLGAAGGGHHPAPAGAGRRLLVAPDPHEEVRWVIRQLARRAEEGMPFHRMAVLYGARSPYATLVREELELAHIPASGPDSTPLSRSAAGRTLGGLLDLCGSDFKRGDVMAWLMGCPLRLPGGQNDGRFSPSQWDALSRKAGVVSEVSQWTERLGRYAGDLRRSSAASRRREEISPAQESLMKREAGAAMGLARFVKTLEADLSPPGAGSSGGLSWEDYSRWGSNLLDRYLVSSDRLPEQEQTALEKIGEILEGIAAAGEVHPAPTLDLFKQAVSDELRAPVGRSGPTGQGVFVGGIASSAGMSFDFIQVVGMIDGAVPSRAGDDPLLPDRERQAAGGPAVGLPLQQGRLAEERLAFQFALSSAPEVVLSFPRADPAAQRACQPSPWFTDQASDLEGSGLHTSGLWSLGRRDWLTVLRSMEDFQHPGAAAAPADLHDYDLQWLWRWKQAGGKTRDHPLAKSGLLRRTLELGVGRYASGNFTEWDGNVSGAAEKAMLAGRLEESPLSPTSLEQWAVCPFRYFMSHVLGIGGMEDPEEVYSITPLDRGALVHEILQKFLAGVIEDGDLPGPEEGWSARHRRTLERVAEAGFSQAEAEGRTGRALMWNLDKQNILDDLHGFLEEDSTLRQRFGTSPAHLEASFGMGGGSWPSPELKLGGNESLRFRGYIDRVDADQAGAQLLVMDYKTGTKAAYTGLGDDPINKGRNLQLAVYSLAARNALGSGARVQAAYWFVTGPGGFALLPEEPVDISDADTLERLKEGVAVIADSIGSGLFPANPGAPGWDGFGNCRHCEFDTLCPSRRDTLWARKKDHPLLAPYLGLSGEDAR